MSHCPWVGVVTLKGPSGSKSQCFLRRAKHFSKLSSQLAHLASHNRFFLFKKIGFVKKNKQNQVCSINQEINRIIRKKLRDDQRGGMENWILGPTPEHSMVGLGQVLTSAILWSIIVTASEWDQQCQKSLTG